MAREPLISKLQIEEYYVHGLATLEETAASLGVTRPTLTRYMKMYGIPIRPKGGLSLGEVADAFAVRDERLFADHDAGMSVSELARKYRLSVQRVYVILRRNSSAPDPA